MGEETSHVCRGCGTKFTVWEGGSRKVDVLFCDVCGAMTDVFFADLGDLYLRYYPKPYLSADPGPIPEDIPGKPLGPYEFHAAVEGTLGPCACGGRFRYAAPPRCPGCRSTEEMWDVDPEGEIVIHD